MTYHYEHVLLFFNDPPTTELSPLSLHDALPILAPRRAYPPGGPAALRRRGSVPHLGRRRTRVAGAVAAGVVVRVLPVDRKSTRLNSSHSQISYAVFCLKKKIHKAVPYLYDNTFG